MFKKKRKLKEKKIPPHLPGKGLQIDSDGLKIDFSNLYSHFILHESLLENQYYNFTLKTFCSDTNCSPLLLPADAADGHGFPGIAEPPPP